MMTVLVAQRHMMRLHSCRCQITTCATPLSTTPFEEYTSYMLRQLGPSSRPLPPLPGQLHMCSCALMDSSKCMRCNTPCITCDGTHYHETGIC